MQLMILTFCSMALLAQSVFAFDKEKFIELGKKCKEDTKTSDEDVKKLMEKQPASSPESKCMLACIFKDMGLMTADGKFDEDGNQKAAEEAFKGNEEKIERAKQFSKLCKEQVNAVEDNSEGCERAAVMHSCAMEKAKELGYKDE